VYLLELIDTVKLGLKLRLFDPVHQLATSMDSEDHSAVVPVLQALVEVVRKGDFQDWSAGLGGLIPAKDALVGASLASLIKSSDGRIATKESLLGHLKYYLRYLHAVSPTEGNVFSEISRLLHELEGHIGGDGVNDDHSEALEEAPDHEVVTEVGCVLCKFQVSGELEHIRGKHFNALTVLVGPSRSYTRRGANSSSAAATKPPSCRQVLLRKSWQPALSCLSYTGISTGYAHVCASSVVF
jgi:hypothetical protein